MQEIGNVLELRDIILPVATVFNQQREIVIKFTTRVSRIEFRQLPVDSAPSSNLVFGVRHSRDGLAATNVIQNSVRVIWPKK